MSRRPHPRRAETNASSPRAWGTCARCGFVTNVDKMRWQVQWRGTKVMNINLLVCEPCYDDPQRQLGTIILPPDPLSVMNARPEPYAIDEYAGILFEKSTPYPDGGNDLARMEGEPIYLEASANGDEEQQVALAVEYSSYYDT